LESNKNNLKGLTVIKKYFFAALSIFLVSCISGEDGKAGEDGKSYRKNLYTGVLYQSDLTTEGSVAYWDKTVFSISDSSLVNVFVRQGSGYMWQIPTWYASTSGFGTIRIIDDAKVDAAWEYKIVIGN
jgi:hypothetical protein